MAKHSTATRKSHSRKILNSNCSTRSIPIPLVKTTKTAENMTTAEISYVMRYKLTKRGISCVVRDDINHEELTKLLGLICPKKRGG